jgi:hypothetical protein
LGGEDGEVSQHFLLGTLALRLLTTKRERLSHDLATLSKDIHNLSERYQFLVTTSIDLAERGIVLSVKMIDLIVYVAETEGKGKGIADRLEGVVNIGQSVTEEAIHMRDAFSQAKEDLEGLRNDLEEKRLQLSRKVVKTGSWKSFFETMSVFIGTIAVVFGTLGFLAALPMGPAALVGVAAVAATSKATAAGGVLSIAARTLAEMLKSSMCRIIFSSARRKLTAAPTENASAETKLDKIVDFLKTMENQLPVVVSHVSQLEEWWGQQGGTLTALMNRGRRFKIQGGKGGLRELEAIKIEWEHVKEEFQGYCGDVREILSPLNHSTLTLCYYCTGQERTAKTNGSETNVDNVE